ncbi:unnamed protein product [Camellia sinensis]
MHKAYAQKLKSLETQILDLKKKQDCQLQLLKQNKEVMKQQSGFKMR